MFAVLHVADFCLQAVLRLERALASRPVALVDETLRPPRVIACTAAARAAGVEPGQTSPQAMARCADVVVRLRKPETEGEARASLLAAAAAVSSSIEDTAPGVCTLQMAGVFVEKREPSLRAVMAQLAELGLVATAGLAATPLLALYAARATGGGKNGNDGREPSGRAERRGEQTEIFAPPTPPVAASTVEDAGADYGAESEDYRWLRPGEENAFLRELPLAVAEPPADLAAILAGWGVRTLGGLTALTKADVTQRLGPAGLALWERAAGGAARPLRPVRPPERFAAELTLEQEIETLEPLLFVLRRFIDRLALELRTAGLVAGELLLELKLVDETVHARTFRLPEPTAREETLFRVLHTHLETVQTAASVVGVSLEGRPVRPLTRQQGLFESALRDPHGFAETLARVATIVGPERVGTPEPVDTHRPDAVRLTPPRAVIPPTGETRRHPLRGWPLRRYRPPLAATVELNGVAPAFVWTAAVQGAVKAAAGPWRASGDWWDASCAWRREEWDVELEPGGVYRLLHEPAGWFLEGEYD